MSIVHSNDSSLLISLTYSLTTCTFIPCEGCTFSICTAIGLAAKTGKVTLSSGSWSSRWWALRPQLLRCSWTAKTRSFITSSAFCCALPCEHLSQSPESPGPYSFVKRLFAYQLDIQYHNIHIYIYIRYPMSDCSLHIFISFHWPNSILKTAFHGELLWRTFAARDPAANCEIGRKMDCPRNDRNGKNWQNTANIEKKWQTTIKQPWAIISWCSYALVIARRPPWKNPAPLERPDGGRTQASVSSVEVIISPNYITITILLKY